jgi:hypothetical protein
MRFKVFEDFNGNVYHSLDDGTLYRRQELLDKIGQLAFDGPPYGSQISKGAARRLRKQLIASKIDEIIEIPDNF